MENPTPISPSEKIRQFVEALSEGIAKAVPEVRSVSLLIDYRGDLNQQEATTFFLPMGPPDLAVWLSQLTLATNFSDQCLRNVYQHRATLTQELVQLTLERSAYRNSAVILSRKAPHGDAATAQETLPAGEAVARPELGRPESPDSGRPD